MSPAYAVAHTDAKRELHGRGKPQIEDFGGPRGRPIQAIFAAGCGTRLALVVAGGARVISVATTLETTTGKHSP